MLLGHTFVFGDIGLRRKKPKKSKKPKNLNKIFLNLCFFPALLWCESVCTLTR